LLTFHKWHLSRKGKRDLKDNGRREKERERGREERDRKRER
jgi:hypothetical protein